MNCHVQASSVRNLASSFGSPSVPQHFGCQFGSFFIPKFNQIDKQGWSKYLKFIFGFEPLQLAQVVLLVEIFYTIIFVH